MTEVMSALTSERFIHEHHYGVLVGEQSQPRCMWPADGQLRNVAVDD
jgi:hypothetical protein